MGPGGIEGNRESFDGPAISADGRYVAFTSLASNLVPGDENDAYDVFVRDLASGVTQRVSVGPGGAEGNNGVSYGPAMSADGRYVAFSSAASNLVPGDTGNKSDIFVHDRASGTNERASVGREGTEADNYSISPAISADGRYVAFFSFASNLVPDDTNDTADIFIRDLASETTERVSVGAEGVEANSFSYYPAVSADGRYVAFSSFASNLVPDDENDTFDMFVRDRASGITERVSVGPQGAEANNSITYGPAISADGRYVAFSSYASNLVPGDESTYASSFGVNSIPDVFVRDRVSGTTERVSVGPGGTEANKSSLGEPAISADGRYVTFPSDASNLVPNDTNNRDDVFVRDRVSGTTERVSVGPGGSEANRDSYYPAITAAGQYVAFLSEASNLVPSDTNDTWDVIVRHRGPATGPGGMSTSAGPGSISVSGWARFSGKVISEAADPADDGAPRAGPAGAELTEASLTYRPEEKDLLLSLRLASLPSAAVGRCVFVVAITHCEGASTGAGAPAVLYGVELDLEGTRYEVRALRAGISSPPPAAPLFALYRCDPNCIEQTRLVGGIGTTGIEVLVSVPLLALGASEGAALSGMRMYTAIGEAAPGALEPLDEARLPDTTIPVAEVSLGVASPGTPTDEVDFDTRAALVDGSFSGTMEVFSLTNGDYEVWARVCLGEVCGVASRAFRIE